MSLIKIHLENTAVNLADEEWNLLVDRLDGYSGSDIRSVVTGALYEPVRSIESACHWKRNLDGSFSLCHVTDSDAVCVSLSDIASSQVHPKPVCVDDFLQAIRTHHPTVSDEQLKRFHDFASVTEY